MNGGVDLRILGIDPGYAIVGFGVLEYNSGKFTVVDYGAITTSSDMDFNRRLVVGCGGEHLALLGRDGCISLDQSGCDTTHCLNRQ